MAEAVVKPATANQLRAEQLVAALWNDPSFGPKIREVAKKQFSDITTLDDDPVVAQLKAQVEAQTKMVSDLLESQKKRDEAADQAKSIADLQAEVDAAAKQFGLTDEGRAKMLDRMKERKSLDPMAAAALIAHQTPPETPRPTWAPRKLNLFGSAERDESWKKLHTDPDGYLDEELHKFSQDPDKYVAETFGNAA